MRAAVVALAIAPLALGGCHARQQPPLAPRPPHRIVISAGPLNVPYTVLGTVNITFDDYDGDAEDFYQTQMGREPDTAGEKLHAVLLLQAWRWYGAQVDALINVALVTVPDDEDQDSASGVAVHFTEPAGGPH